MKLSRVTFRLTDSRRRAFRGIRQDYQLTWSLGALRDDNMDPRTLEKWLSRQFTIYLTINLRARNDWQPIDWLISHGRIKSNMEMLKSNQGPVNLHFISTCKRGFRLQQLGFRCSRGSCWFWGDKERSLLDVRGEVSVTNSASPITPSEWCSR